MHLLGNAAMLLGPICQHASCIEALRQQRASKKYAAYTAFAGMPLSIPGLLARRKT